MKREQLAARIVRDLFTDGTGRKAARLVMEYAGAKLDGPGWSRAGAVYRVERALRKAGSRPKRRSVAR